MSLVEGLFALVVCIGLVFLIRWSIREDNDNRHKLDVAISLCSPYQMQNWWEKDEHIYAACATVDGKGEIKVSK